MRTCFGLTLVLLGLRWVVPAAAELHPLGDAELAAVAGRGLVGISVVDGTARIDLNARVSTFTESDSLKAGYYDDEVLGLGWDQDWTQVSLGTAQQEAAFGGLYLEAQFNNFDDPATRSLSRFTFGTADFSGALEAMFVSFSGDVRVDGVALEGHRMEPTFSQLDFDHTAFSVSVVLEGPQRGIWVQWDDAATRP